MTPKSSIERIYHGRFDYTPENYAALRYVTYILGARYLTTVREEKGGTYYVGVHDEVSARPRGYCQLVVSFDTDPKLCEMLLGEVQKGIERLAAEAPSEQEVNEAMLYFRKVNAESRSKNLKSTSYWLNKMRAEYFDGVDLDKDNEALFTAVTPPRCAAWRVKSSPRATAIRRSSRRSDAGQPAFRNETRAAHRGRPGFSCVSPRAICA